MSLYKVGKIYYVYIKHRGERVRRTTGTSNWEEAQRFHDKLKSDLWEIVDAAPSGYSWNDASRAWWAAAPRSKSDLYALRALNYPNRSLSECTAASFEETLAGKSPATFNRIKTLINAILNLAKENGHVEKVAKIRRREEPMLDFRFLTKEEWERLLVALPDHLKAPARFAIATGLRLNNVMTMTWNKVDISQRMAWVNAPDTKGKKAINIPLSDDGVAVLREQLNKHDTWVFPYQGKGRKAGPPIKKMKTAWHAALERAKLGHMDRWVTPDGKKHQKWNSDVDFHTFRHTFASWHVMGGTPLEVLQRYGGWSDLRMVMKYAHLHPGHIARYANNAKPWSPKDSQSTPETIPKKKARKR
jgi:integrase